MTDIPQMVGLSRTFMSANWSHHVELATGRIVPSRKRSRGIKQIHWRSCWRDAATPMRLQSVATRRMH